MNWEAFAAIVQAIQTTAVIVALVYAWQQVKHARHDVRLGALWEIFKELDTDELRASRGYVYKNREIYHSLKNEGASLGNLPIEALKSAQVVSTTLDRLGFMVDRGLVPVDLIWDGYRYVIARSWIALEPFIRLARKERGRMSYQSYFEFLAIYVFEHYITPEEVRFADEP